MGLIAYGVAQTEVVKRWRNTTLLVHNMTNQERILAISKELDLSHIGSNLSCLPVLEEIYHKKKPEDKVILCNAHAHLSHLVVRESKMFDEDEYEKIGTGVVEDLIKQFGIHCDRKAGCDASGGSLGHGLGIGIGYALADPKRDVYVIVSEGSMMEGSSWEALRIIDDLNIENIYIHVNANGYSAVAKIDLEKLKQRLVAFLDHPGSMRIKFHETDNGEGFEGVEGHYKKA